MPQFTLEGFFLASWPYLVALLCLILSMGITWQWARNHLRDNADDTASTSEMILQCREMLEEGELTAEEFRLIKSRLSGGSVAASPRTSEGALNLKTESSSTASLPAAENPPR